MNQQQKKRVLRQVLKALDTGQLNGKSKDGKEIRRVAEYMLAKARRGKKI